MSDQISNPKLSADSRSASSTRFQVGLVALFAAFAFLVGLCRLIAPGWQTNDDVAMSMIAHGYGIASTASPKLVFSNVLWGYLVQAIPSIQGMPGYSVGTMAVLVIVGATLLYCARQTGVPTVNAILIFAIVMVRPVLSPQFTVNAGLLMVGAILCWLTYAKQKDDKIILVVGCILAFLSYLIRSQECLLVFLIALPLMPWKTILECRSFRLALVVLAISILVAGLIDKTAYQSQEWEAFNQLNSIRIPFTDYGARDILKRHPEILNQYQTSSNDLDLIRYWFFADPAVADPSKLSVLLDAAKPTIPIAESLENGWLGVVALSFANLVVYVVIAEVLLVLKPGWQVVAMWVLSVSAFFCIGFMGRPGITRIYEPVLYMLVIAPNFIEKRLFERNPKLQNIVMVLVLTVSAVVDFNLVYGDTKIVQAYSNQVRQGLKGFPSYPITVFAEVFPYEFVYPVLGATDTEMSYRYFGLNVFTLAPYSVAYMETVAGRTLAAQLTGERGLPIVADQQRMSYLAKYCEEHMQGKFREMSTQQYGAVQVHRVQCTDRSESGH